MKLREISTLFKPNLFYLGSLLILVIRYIYNQSMRFWVIFTVIIMILSRYRYRPVTVPLPLQRYRDPSSATVTEHYWPLRTVPQRYLTLQALLNITERYWTLPSVTERYPALPSVTQRYWTLLNVTERYRTLPNLCNVQQIIRFDSN